MAKSERLEKDIRVLDLKGNQRASNKGTCDLLVFKHALKRQFFQRETHARANDLLINTDVPFAKWLENDVEPRMDNLQGMDARGGFGQPHMARTPGSKRDSLVVIG